MNTDTISPIQARAERLLSQQLERLSDYGDNIRRLLKFIDDHKEQLAGVHWSACHIYCEITLQPTTTPGDIFESSARLIARRFPGVVWLRKKNSGTCGSLDWCARKDDVGLKIANAETIRWIPEPESTINLDNPSI